MLVFVYVQFCISSTFIMLVLWNPFSVLAKWWYDKLEVSDIMFEIFWSMGLKAFLKVIKICRSIVRECVGKLAFFKKSRITTLRKGVSLILWLFRWPTYCQGNICICICICRWPTFCLRTTRKMLQTITFFFTPGLPSTSGFPMST